MEGLPGRGGNLIGRRWSWVDELCLVDFGDPYPGEPAHFLPPLFSAHQKPSTPIFVVVAPLTTTHRGLSFHIEIEVSPDTGLDEVSFVQCELIRSVNGHRLVHRLGTVDQETSRHVAKIIKTLLDTEPESIRTSAPYTAWR